MVYQNSKENPPFTLSQLDLPSCCWMCLFSQWIPATAKFSSIFFIFSCIILVIMSRRHENYSITSASLPLTEIITSLSEGKARGCFRLPCVIVPSLAAGHVSTWMNGLQWGSLTPGRWAKLCLFCIWPSAGRNQSVNPPHADESESLSVRPSVRDSRSH